MSFQVGFGGLPVPLAAAGSSPPGPSLDWWEALCTQTTVNPAQATQVLQEFRESDRAFEASKFFLQCPASTPLAKFHAALVLMHVTLNKQWTVLAAAEKRELQLLIWSIISDGIQSNQYPPFVLNKMIQLLALLWKRGWSEAELGTKQESIASVSSVVGSRPHLAVGSKMLRIVVEEFGSKSSAEIGLPLEFHRIAHAAFQSFGLNETLELSNQALAQCLTVIMSERESIDRLLADVNSLSEVLKLVNTVLLWDFDNFDAVSIRSPRHQQNSSINGVHSSGDGDDRDITGRLPLPDTWAPVLVNVQLLESLFRGYTYLKSLVPAVPHTCHNVLFACLVDLRALLNSLASMSGAIFASEEQKAEVVAFIAGHTCDLLGTMLSDGTDSNSKSATSEAAADDRAKAFEQLGSLLQRVLRNVPFQYLCRLPVFERLVLTLGKTTYELARELRLMAEYQLYSQHGEGRLTEEHSKHLTVFDLSLAEPDLLNGWRGECIGILIDSWCLVLGHDVMLQSVNAVAVSSDDADSAAVAQGVKQGLQGIAAEVFAQLFECVLRTTLSDSLDNEEEEEDEDQEAIAVRSLDELLAGICTIGRTNANLALDYVSGKISQQFQAINALLNGSAAVDSKESLKILETIRVSILFACHLIDDLFSAEDEASLNAAETPTIPSFVVDALASNAVAAVTSLHALLTCMSQLLTCQVLVNSAPVTAAKASLQSPLILKQLLQFFSKYIVRYVDARPELYPPGTVLGVPHLFTLHGADFTSVIELLLNISCQVVVGMSMQQEVIEAMAGVYIAFSRSGSPLRIESVVSHPMLSQLFASLFAHGHLSQLTSDGLSHCYRSLGALTMASQGDSFAQICGLVHARGQRLADQYQQSGRVIDSMMPELSQCVSCMTGLASCSQNEDKAGILHELFNQCLPPIQRYIDEGSPTDAVLKAYVVMLRDYTEAQLPIMNRASSVLLYQCINLLLPLISRRLQQTAVVDQTSQLAQIEEASFRSDLILLVFQLLNHLSSKDLVIDEEILDPHDPSSQVSLETLVGGMLLNGLTFFMPLMTPEFLRSFPLTCDRYFSFVGYFLQTYELTFGEYVRDLPPDAASGVLQSLCDQLLWSAGAVDETSARLALHALQSIASFHFKSIKEGGIGYGAAVAAASLSSALDRLLRMVVFVDQCEYGISWMRIEPAANALFVLIALQSTQFQVTAQDIVLRQPSGIQPVLMESFQRLLVTDGLDFTRIDRATRQKFAQNLKGFVTAVRPLVTYQ